MRRKRQDMISVPFDRISVFFNLENGCQPEYILG